MGIFALSKKVNMKRLLILTFLACLVQGILFAQHNPLVIQGTGGKFFLLHTVEAKENWYSLGRLYNLPPKDIAAFNKLEMSMALDIGQTLNIPLAAANFDQRKNQGAGEALIPVYHTVQEREWMFKLSSLYNDVPVTSLEKWNNIKRDQVKQGMPMIIGYLKVKTDQSPLGAEPPAAPPLLTAGSASKPAEKPIEAATDKPVTPNATSTTTPAASSANAATSAPATSAPAANTPATNVPSGTPKAGSYGSTHPGGGFFTAEYQPKANKSLTGQGGTFKSSSGWSDGKYYVLMNDIPKGTIVKLFANGKTIYAKVLGDLPEMKESAGLLAWVSNAGSTELGSADGRFAIEISY